MTAKKGNARWPLTPGAVPSLTKTRVPTRMRSPHSASSQVSSSPPSSCFSPPSSSSPPLVLPFVFLLVAVVYGERAVGVSSLPCCRSTRRCCYDRKRSED